MNNSKILTRTIFGILSVLFFTIFTATVFSLGLTALSLAIGLTSGLAFSLVMFASDVFFQGISLKNLNAITLGLFFGCLLGQAINLALTGAFDAAALALWPEMLHLIKAGVFLFSIYWGVTFIIKASDEVYISVPFIKFKPASEKKKDLILDFSSLCDTRLIDLASSGLLDNRLILPHFVQKEIYEMVEAQNEGCRFKARRALDVIKKLEEMSELNMRNSETDFPEIKEIQNKLIRLARMQDAHLLTSEINQIDQSIIEGVRIINLNTLSKALKPLTQAGESIQIKVQRYGKEARQGVGYLDDGTMVVINGGAEYIGETIKAQVLSVKHTSSGRMIFCNAVDEEYSMPPCEELVEPSAKKFFAL